MNIEPSRSGAVYSLRRVVRSSVTVYLCVMTLAWFYADHAAFQPPPAEYGPNDPGIGFVPARNGQRIAVLELPHSSAPFTVLYAHGNAEDLGGIRDWLETYRQRGFAVYSFDPRGYGQSGGQPGIRSACEDIETVYRWLLRERGVDPRRLLLHGRSVGAAMVLDLAAREPAAGVILESAFLTAFRVRTGIPLFPIDRLRNDRAIRLLQCPLLVIHGEEDRLMPAWHGRRLYALAPVPMRAYWVPRAEHNDVPFVDEAEYWRQIDTFAAWVRESPLR